MVLGESASALISATSARFSFSKSGGRDGRRRNSSVQRIDSSEAPASGIESSNAVLTLDVENELIFLPSVVGAISRALGGFLSDSALEVGVSVPEMDQVAVEWDFTVDSGKLRGHQF